jgi:integrase
MRLFQDAFDAASPGGSVDITVEEYLKWWLTEELPGTVKASTEENYRTVVSAYVIPSLGGVPLVSLAPEHVRQMHRSLADRGLSPRAQQYAHAVLSRALTLAERRDLIRRNPARLVDRPRVERHEALRLTPAEARRLVAYGEHDRLGALFTVALAMGLRRGELLGLRWEDIDFDAGTLSVSGSLQRQNHKLVRSAPKTARSRRVLPVPEQAAAALLAHRERQGKERAAAKGRWTESGYVFTTPLGTPVDPRNLLRVWKSFRTQAKLPTALRVHDLRHSTATLLLSQGVPMPVITALLGHAGIAITADIYAHVDHTLLTDAADAMESVLNASSPRRASTKRRRRRQ